MPGFFSSLLEVGSFDTPSLVLGMAVSGSLALVSDWSAGLRVIDISDLSSPTEVGFLDTVGTAQDVAVSDTLALVADYSAGLRVIDISNPASPTEVGFLDTPGIAGALPLESPSLGTPTGTARSTPPICGWWPPPWAPRTPTPTSTATASWTSETWRWWARNFAP